MTWVRGRDTGGFQPRARVCLQTFPWVRSLNLQGTPIGATELRFGAWPMLRVLDLSFCDGVDDISAVDWVRTLRAA